MARTTKNETAAPDAAQDAGGQSGVSQDTQEVKAAPAASEGPQEGAATHEVIGPDSEDELLGCQDEAELAEGVLCPYAVVGCNALNLRAEPSMDALIMAKLPWGAGVFGDDDSAEDGWRQVFTGRLSGWVMDKYLEELQPLELAAYGAG